MLMFLLTLTGAASLVIMIRSIFVAEHRSFLEGICHFLFGLFSFIVTIILTNGVAP